MATVLDMVTPHVTPHGPPGGRSDLGFGGRSDLGFGIVC